MAASEGTLGLLHTLVAQSLIDKIKAGEATASDVSNALKMLKDNNITCSVEDDNELGELTKLLGKKPAPAESSDFEAALEAAEFDVSRMN